MAKCQVLAQYWQLPLDRVVTGLRHAFSLRDACFARDDSLKEGRSLDLWLSVLQSTEAGGEIPAEGAKILHSFLITQTQSASCERTFSTVLELKKHLGDGATARSIC